MYASSIYGSMWAAVDQGAVIVNDWVARVAAAGGTVSNTTKAAVKTFVDACIADGTWSALLRLNLCCGDFNASLVPVVNAMGSANDAAILLTGSNYSEALGWNCGGGRYINTGLQPTGAVKGLSVYVRAFGNTSAQALIGCRDAGTTQVYRIIVDTTLAAHCGGNTPVAGGSVLAGHLHVSRQTTTDVRLYRNATQQAQVTTGTASGNAGVDAYVMAANYGGTPVYASSATRIAGYSFDSGMTPTGVGKFRDALQAFQTTLGRQV